MSTQDNKGSSDNLPSKENQSPEYSVHDLQKKTSINLVKLIELSNQVPALTHLEIGKILGTSKQNVNKLIKRLGIIKAQAESFKHNKADIYEAQLQRILAIGVPDEKIKKANLKDIIWSVGVLEDKVQRLRDKGSTTRGLESLIKGIHIDIKAGTVTIASPMPAKPLDHTDNPESPIEVQPNDSDNEPIDI